MKQRRKNDKSGRLGKKTVLAGSRDSVSYRSFLSYYDVKSKLIDYET